MFPVGRGSGESWVVEVRVWEVGGVDKYGSTTDTKTGYRDTDPGRRTGHTDLRGGLSGGGSELAPQWRSPRHTRKCDSPPTTGVRCRSSRQKRGRRVGRDSRGEWRHRVTTVLIHMLVTSDSPLGEGRTAVDTSV